MVYSFTERLWALLFYDTMHGSSNFLFTLQLIFFDFLVTFVWSIFNHIPLPLLTSAFNICCHTGNFVYFVHFLICSDSPSPLLSYWPFHLPYMQDMWYSQQWWRFIFQDLTPCKLLYEYKCFGGACCCPWRWKQQAPPKLWYPYSNLHSITSQKTGVFTVPKMLLFYTFSLCLYLSATGHNLYPCIAISSASVKLTCAFRV